MPRGKPRKIIVDTNIWISFLIGKELQYLKDLILDEKVKIITCDQLLSEIRIVTSRENLRKYFDREKVEDFLTLLEILGKRVSVDKIESYCRDPKDDFLLALSKESRAHYLITGDKDLLELKTHGKTRILTAREFRDILP
jgi:hypothetical protein